MGAVGPRRSAVSCSHLVSSKPRTQPEEPPVPDRTVAADVLVCSPTRSSVTLEITTSDGTVGYGDATLNRRELSVASCLRGYVVPLLD